MGQSLSEAYLGQASLDLQSPQQHGMFCWTAPRHGAQDLRIEGHQLLAAESNELVDPLERRLAVELLEACVLVGCGTSRTTSLSL